MMRAVERTAVRAGLHLTYSQGFNPHPLISLTLPRPVGVATADDLLVVSVEETPGQAGESVSAALNAHCPPGLQFRTARLLPRGASPQVRTTRYQLPLSPDQAAAMEPRVRELQQADAWPIERAEKGERDRDRDGRSPVVRTINIKPLVAELALGPDGLVFVLHAGGGQSARPAEVVTLLGLEPQAASRLVRVAVEYDALPPP